MWLASGAVVPFVVPVRRMRDPILGRCEFRSTLRVGIGLGDSRIVLG